MHRRVDVRATVCAKGIRGQRERIAPAHVLEEVEAHRRVALVDRRRGRIERRGGVDPPVRRQGAECVLAAGRCRARRRGEDRQSAKESTHRHPLPSLHRIPPCRLHKINRISSRNYADHPRISADLFRVDPR